MVLQYYFEQFPKAINYKAPHFTKDKKFDFIIIGPTGYIGYETVFKAVLLLKNYRWAVAGRDLMKITDTLIEIENATGENLKRIPVLEADCNNEKSLYDIIRNTKILINCCGLCWSYCERMIKFCIVSKTHYVDTNFDSNFIKKIQQSYQYSAENNKVYIVHSCGFLGFANEIFVNVIQKVFDGSIESIECTSSLSFTKEPGIKTSYVITRNLWNSLMETLRKFLKSFQVPIKCTMADSRHLFNKVLKNPSEALKVSEMIKIKCPLIEKNIFPLGQNPNEDNAPIEISSYLCLPSLWCTLKFIIWMSFVSLLLSIPGLNYLISALPTLFSCFHVPPKKVYNNDPDNLLIAINYNITGMRRTRFPLQTSLYSNTIYYKAGPRKTLKAKFHAFNPLYNFSSAALLTSAVTLLEDSNTLPTKGGIYTPGLAFSKTNLVRRLEEFEDLYSFEIFEEQEGRRRILYLT